MEVLSIELIIGLALILLTVGCYLTKNFNYWKIRNVLGPKPIPLFGTFLSVHLHRISIADYFKSVYDLYPNEAAVGLFFNSTPALLVKDLSMIKDVLINSFIKFPNRGINIHPDIEPLQKQSLLFLEYDRWIPLRRKLMPTFTSAKLKEMFYLIDECADHLVDYLKDLVPDERIIDCHELSAKFTIDVIGVFVFGLKVNAISDENSEFRKIGRAVFADTFRNQLTMISRFWPHWIVLIFKRFLRNETVVTFFVDIVKSTIEYRKKNNIRRHDFVGLLMDMRDNPEQVGEEISDEILTAQAFIFFAAGFETSSTTISSAMYELALNPDIQEKLRKEVEDTFEKYNGKLNYTAIKNMRYLDKVIQETLRKYPSVPGFPREAVKDHTFSDNNISITKGTKIFIPVYAIHHDPNIYPDPEKFDPERFNQEAVKLRPQMSFLPFGDGPRICIGKRFSDNQTKLCLATVLKHFRLEVCDKTCKYYIKQPGFFLMSPKNGLHIRIKKL